MITFDLTWWISFCTFLIAALVVDLFYLHKDSHTMKTKEAFLTAFFWVVAALAFAGFIGYTKGQVKALEFLTGYVIEKSLSVDNLFVFLLIFQHFQVPYEYRYRVLMWGIIGALIMRLTFIVLGLALVSAFHWTLYLFGLFLIVTGILMFKKQEKEIAPENNPLVRLSKRFFSMTDSWSEGRFFVRKNKKLFATPLFLVLVTIESSDVLFALDSIPAVFAITLDPFIVFSCNAFAILGLRSLFFVLQDLLQLFSLLHYGVCLILIFVGTKMVIEPLFKIPTAISLATVLAILTSSILLSRVKR